MVLSGRTWLLGGIGLVALGAGCAGKQTGGEMGEDCYRDEDCKVGLVCVATPAPDGPRVCSNDVTGLASSVAGPPPDAGTPVDDAATPVDDAATPVDDAATPGAGGSP